ncbi:hypothetical protein SARC_10709 [Sphaeroforma arctica JP610]|uniref:Uncharacterized protein n=1 Tax=Sphaeroforma arctica JP610 TaxID=667725 RepID=A0A0L0FJZ5_9EUKA|nr:hypothetical protein SARC_10709 [Sphaeroforma arctica JP610]KNC76811.1 hypothetical protein SARC_10709 [Sphaeroforma arctica JP610]|eukprot:XP_014150713.1 hypothetical protein SARC_10709 [Sphaeroforma arctica JP610]
MCLAAAVVYGLPLNKTNVNAVVVEEHLATGDLSLPDGFMFGSSSAATQIEENNTNTDWWWYGAPEADGSLGKLKNPVGDAAMSYSMTSEDIYLMKAMGLNSYRFFHRMGSRLAEWPKRQL